MIHFTHAGRLVTVVCVCITMHDGKVLILSFTLIASTQTSSFKLTGFNKFLDVNSKGNCQFNTFFFLTSYVSYVLHYGMYNPIFLNVSMIGNIVKISQYVCKMLKTYYVCCTVLIKILTLSA